MEPIPHHSKHHIFLSHSGHQKGFAIDLCHRLSSFSYAVFFDQDHHSLPPGQPFPPLIFSAAATCKLAIVVLSDDFLSSRWPMLELCTFADRLPSQSDCSAVTLLPLFFKLSPEDVKNAENLKRWRKAWEVFEQTDARINASKCEQVVTNLLPRLSGIVRRPEAVQGEASYLDVVVDAISAILPPPGGFTNPYKKYCGRDRLCKVILDKFRDLEDTPSSPVDVSILGIYGVPGTGKSTLCRFLCDSMFGELNGNVFYLDLPPDSDSRVDKMVLIKQEYSKLLPKFNPYVRDIASMDPNVVLHLLSHATSIKKVLLVLDNIAASNLESYMSILQPLLSSAVLGHGSRIMLVAHSIATLRILQSLMEGERCSKYRYATMKVPCLTVEEAIEVIRNQCPSMKEELATRLRSKIILPASSSIYIPFVLQQIGVFFKKKYCRGVEELENLWKMVDETKQNVVQKLVGMNFKLLPEDLRILFLDITLSIIPAGYSRLDDAIPILSRMHGIRDTATLRGKIRDLEKHCALSVIHNQLKVHDIFREYASNINGNGNSASYVFQPSVDISGDQVRKQCFKYAEARSICIGTCTESPCDQEGRVHVELGATAQVLFVRNSCPNTKSRIDLSGDLSSLVCFRAEGVQQIALSPCGNGANLSNLVRLELRNENLAQDTGMIRWSGQKRKRTGSSFSDFMSHLIRYGTQSMLRSLKPLIFACPQQCLGDFISSGRMTGLRVLILENFPGIPRLEIAGQSCPELEVLIVRNVANEEMDVRIEKAPKLKRLTTRQTNRNADPLRSPKKSRKLALQIRECPELREMYVNGSFDQVKVDGLLPSKLRHLDVTSGRCSDFLPWKLVSSSAHQLAELRSLRLSCTKVAESLHFTGEHLGCLPSLRWLHLVCCTGLTHLSMDRSCMPNLVDLKVSDCDELLILEGVEDMLMQKLKVLHLIGLPQLRLECDFMCDVSLQLEWIDVWRCPQVRIYWNVLEASKNLQTIRLSGSGVAVVQKKKPDEKKKKNVDGECKLQVPLDRWMFSKWHFTFLKTVWITALHGLREIEGIQHLRSLSRLSLFDLPNLTRVSGSWPARILSIRFDNCPMLFEVPPLERTPNVRDLQFCKCGRLKAVKACFRRMKRLRFIEFVECESMEAFPMEGQTLGTDEWRSRGMEHSLPRRLRVYGSRFARVEAMQAWLLRRDSKMGSLLFEATVEALMWEHMEKGTLEALDALHDYFSTLVGVAEEHDLLYLKELFFPSKPQSRPVFYFLYASQKPVEVKVFEEWILHKFPQLSIQHSSLP